jgi:hypothetical protein
MATLASLKLVTAKKPSNQAPIIQRRNKLCAKIFEQLALAKAQKNGETYAPTRTKTVTNTDGERVQVSVPKRIKPWWFVGENGKVCISIRYGAKVIAITPKANAIEVNSPAALIEALETVGTAVQAGELDSQIEAVSGQIRSAFNK